jgi:hypothetical protein
MNNNIVTFPSPVNPDDTLEEHAAEIRKGLQDIRRAMSNALDIALAVGQRLNIAKDQVGDGKWARWLRDNCQIARSTAHLYMRLANHQGDIDEARVQFPELSLRGARRLLTKSIKLETEEVEAEEPDQEEPDEAGGEGAPPDHTADLQAAWKAASIAEQEKFLTTILATTKISDLLRLLPKKKCDEIRQRAAGSLAASCTTKKQRNAINKARKSSSKYLELDATHIS